MEGSSTNIEEMKITDQRTPTFYLYHPCFLLEEVVGALFKCLGFEIGNKTKDPSALEDDTITEEITPKTEHESSQSSEEEQEFSRRGSRRPGLSPGSSPGHN